MHFVARPLLGTNLGLRVFGGATQKQGADARFDARPFRWRESRLVRPDDRPTRNPSACRNTRSRLQALRWPRGPGAGSVGAPVSSASQITRLRTVLPRNRAGPLVVHACAAAARRGARSSMREEKGNIESIWYAALGRELGVGSTYLTSSAVRTWRVPRSLRPCFPCTCVALASPIDL